MTRPLDRSSRIPQQGELDSEHGEFWVESPFQLRSAGHNLSAYERNRLFLNDQGERFLDASFASRTDIDSDSRFAIAADFDRDGRSDLLVGSDGGGALRLFQNRCPDQNSRVEIHLHGTTSNRAAIGSRVTLECAELTLTRDVFPVNGFRGQAPAELLIGTGRASTIDRLTVRWPNGTTQEFVDLPSDSQLEIKEGATGVDVIPRPRSNTDRTDAATDRN